MRDLKLAEESEDSKKKILQLTLGRHQRGLMMPWVYHVIASKEVKLESVMEDCARLEKTKFLAALPPLSLCNPTNCVLCTCSFNCLFSE